MDFLKGCPTHLDIEVGGSRFYLVHGFPGANIHDEVWFRPAPDTPNPISDATLIIGHTPVPGMFRPYDRKGYERELTDRGEHPRIFHGREFIDIDCGCAYDNPLKTLGCLRLDDMAEFYI